MMAATIASDAAFGASKAPGSRQARRVGRPGQGIIEANRKTEICRHWMSGACPFGVKCAFAHGAQELRSLAVDAERARLNATGIKTGQFPNVVTGDPAASCRDPWCIDRHDRTTYSTDKSRLPSGSKDYFYRVPRTNDGGLDGFLLERPAPSDAMDDVHLSMNRLRLDSQQTRSNKHAAHMGDMSRGGFSLWESPDTMLQGAALGCTGTTGHKYKVPEEPPRRVLDKVTSRAVSGEVPRRAFDEVNTNAVSTKPVVLTTAVAEGGLRGSIRERETWAKVARGDYDAAGNDPLCMKGNPYGGMVETGCRSGESSRPRPDVAYESRHELAPRTCDFSYFQSHRASHRSASMPPKRSSAGRPASSASAAPTTPGNAVGWDPIRYDAPHFGDASTALCEGKKKAATGTGRPSLTMQQRLDEDGTPAGMVSALLEAAKARPLSERPITPWCASPVPPAEAPNSNKRLPVETAEVPRSPCFFRNNGTRFVSESTRAMPNADRESTMASLNSGLQPILRNQKPPAPSPKYDGVFQVATDITNFPPRPTFARGPGALKTGTTTGVNSSMW